MARNERTADRRKLAVLLVLGALIKAVHWLESTALPFMDAPIFDSVVYLRQAVAVRSGDFGHATLLAFSPLYGYFLALVGDGAIFVQLGLGTLNLWLMYRLVEKSFDARTALTAAALYLGYGLLLFYETKVMSEALGLTLTLLAWMAYVSPEFERGRWQTALGCGAVLGLATLARANVLLCAPFFALLALAPWSGRAKVKKAGSRPRLRRAGFLALGYGAVLALMGTWNFAHTGHFVPVIMMSRTAATATSTSEYDGSLRAFGRDGDGAVSVWNVVDQAEARLSGEAGSGPAPSIDLVGWIAGSPPKLARTLSDTESTYQYGYYGERTELRLLGMTPVSFGMLGVLALLGVVFVWRRRGPRTLLPYLPLVLGTLCVTTLFHPSSRYRVVMVLPMIVLAAHALACTARLGDRRNRVVLGVSLALVCGFFAWRTIGYELSHPGMWQLRVAEAEAARGDLFAASQRVDRALELEPEYEGVRRRVELLRPSGETEP